MKTPKKHNLEEKRALFDENLGRSASDKRMLKWPTKKALSVIEHNIDVELTQLNLLTMFLEMALIFNSSLIS